MRTNRMFFDHICVLLRLQNRTFLLEILLRDCL